MNPQPPENFIRKNIEISIIVANIFIAPILQLITINTLRKFSQFSYDNFTFLIPIFIFIASILYGFFNKNGKGLTILKVIAGIILCIVLINLALTQTVGITIFSVYSFVLGI